MLFEITHIYSSALSDILIICPSSGGYTYQTILGHEFELLPSKMYSICVPCKYCMFCTSLHISVHLMIVRFPRHRNLCDTWPFWFAWSKTLVRFWKGDYLAPLCILPRSASYPLICSFVCLPGALFYPLLTTIPPYNQFNFLFHQPAPTSCKQFYHRHPAIIFIKILN